MNYAYRALALGLLVVGINAQAMDDQKHLLGPEMSPAEQTSLDTLGSFLDKDMKAAALRLMNPHQVLGFYSNNKTVQAFISDKFYQKAIADKDFARKLVFFVTVASVTEARNDDKEMKLLQEDLDMPRDSSAILRNHWQDRMDHYHCTDDGYYVSEYYHDLPARYLKQNGCLPKPEIVRNEWSKERYQPLRFYLQERSDYYKKFEKAHPDGRSRLIRRELFKRWLEKEKDELDKLVAVDAKPQDAMTE